MAAYDVQQWAAALQALLPGSSRDDHLLDGRPTTPVTCTIQIQWTENAVAATHSRRTSMRCKRPLTFCTCSHDDHLTSASRAAARIARGFTLVEMHDRDSHRALSDRRPADAGAGHEAHGVSAKRALATPGQRAHGDDIDRGRDSVGGILSQPTLNTAASSFPVGGRIHAWCRTIIWWARAARRTAAPGNSITVRYSTAGTAAGDNTINCTGNASVAANQLHQHLQLSLPAPAATHDLSSW